MYSFCRTLIHINIYSLIATTGRQNRGIDIEYARQKGVLVSGTGGGGNATIEHIWALIMSVARYIVTEHINVTTANPQWQTVIPMGGYPL